MKICITSTGKNLNAQVDPRFGRCLYFLILNDQTEKIKVIINPAVNYAGGAGIAAAQTVINQGVAAVVTGNVGPNAFMVLNQANIKIYIGALGMTCRQALAAFNQGKLSQAQPPQFGPGMMPPGRFGPGMGRVRGPGRLGRGRGRRRSW